MSRGQVVYTKYVSPAIMGSAPLTEDVLKMISPGARLLAFYVDGKNNELVADAVHFSVDPVCRGNQVCL